MSFAVKCGDNIEELTKLEANSIDAMVQDPPAGINFMNRDFDSDKGGKDAWIEWMTRVFKACYRVLKPGAHALVWAIPKTAHWTEVALEQAGFEKRDRLSHLFDGSETARAFLASLTPLQMDTFMRAFGDASVIAHIFSQGAPKILDLSKAIDRRKGATRKVKSRKKHSPVVGATGLGQFQAKEYVYSDPATDEAKQWDGWMTSLKPAVEYWILVRKPLGESTVTDNTLVHGTGALNIDACRVTRASEDGAKGGFPSNIILSHSRRAYLCNGCKGALESDFWTETNLTRCHICGQNSWTLSPGCVLKGRRSVKNPSGSVKAKDYTQVNTYGGGFNKTDDFERFGGQDGVEIVDDWDCVETCAVRMLDRQSGQSETRRVEKPSECKEFKGGSTYIASYHTNRPPRGFTDQGGASRFFNVMPPEVPFLYHAKPAGWERHAGCEQLYWMVDEESPCGYALTNEAHWIELGQKEERIYQTEQRLVRLRGQGNIHNTVKSISLMQFFADLICPPGGTILDPFFGSGSTGCGALLSGFNVIGIDSDHNYCHISEFRCDFWMRVAEMFQATNSRLPNGVYDRIELRATAEIKLSKTNTVQPKMF